MLFHLQLNSCELVGFPSVSPEPLIALPGMGTQGAGPSADEPVLWVSSGCDCVSELFSLLSTQSFSL